MTSMSFYEARTRLSELLDQVAKGQEILITRRGKPAALLSPPPSKTNKDVQEVVNKMLEYRDSRNRTLGTSCVREVIEEGRRY